MATLAEVVGLVRNVLQDTDDTNYIWPQSIVEQFVAEGTRRLSPRCLKRGMFKISPNGEITEWSLDTIFSASVVEVEGVIGPEDTLPEWDVYAGQLMFEFPPEVQFWVRGLVRYSDVTELPLELVDAVVYYAASRCLNWLEKRGGDALKRYLANQGEFVEREIRSLSDSYMADFVQVREENATSVARRL